MSDVKGDNYTKFDSPTMRALLGAEWKGKVRAIYDTYECASLAAGSTIKVGKLRKDEVFLTGWVIADDLSSAGTLALGDGTTADKYLAATVFTTAGQVTQAAAIGGVGDKATADKDIVLTTATEEMIGTIKVVLLIAAPN